MKILLITSYFPPDRAISAVRPYMFARELTRMGHRVTVIRSGYFDMEPTNDPVPFDGFEVISALGRDCPAERFMRGEEGGTETVPKPMFPSMPRWLRKPLKLVRDSGRVIMDKPPKCIDRAAHVLSRQKRLIDRMHERGRQFEIVFATTGDIENIYAGEYAARVFGAKWIMDFRDSLYTTAMHLQDIYHKYYAKQAMSLGVSKADLVTGVTSGLCDELRTYGPDARVELIYNGFDDTVPPAPVEPPRDMLTLCYTGRLYDLQQEALDSLARCLADLIGDGRIDEDKIHFIYAGPHSQQFCDAFSRAGVSGILEDRGMLTREQAQEIQQTSDILISLLWNIAESQGCMGGKFGESIKTRKIIMSFVSGDLPGCELMELQRKYNYGYCYECCSGSEGMKDLEDYLKGLYDRKLSEGRLDGTMSDELYEMFSYTGLAKKLEGLMKELLSSDTDAPDQ